MRRVAGSGTRRWVALAALLSVALGAAAGDIGQPPPLVAEVRAPGGYPRVPAEAFLAQVQALPIAELRPLAEQGRADAQIQLARLLWWDGDTQTPLALLRPHAEAGVPVAQYLLGSYLRLRNRDLPGALAWLSAAARQGHPVAQETLAGAYENGSLGVQRSDDEAFRLYLAAGRAGLRHAQMNVALHLCRGRAVAQDKALGRAWLASSQQGQPVPLPAASAGCD
jgi:TPR repeat protein